MNIKIYREHKRLYYNPSSKSWLKEIHEEQDASSSVISIESDLQVNPSHSDSYAVSESDNINWDQSPIDEDDAENLPEHGNYYTKVLYHRCILLTNGS